MAQELPYGQGSTRLADYHARLLDAVEQAVIATDLQGRIVYWNRFAEKLYGWARNEVLGRSVQELTPSSTTVEEAQAIMKQLSKGETWRGNFEVQRKDGSKFIAHVVDSAVYDGDNQIGVVGVSTDVTEILEAVDQRERLLESLEQEHRLVEELSTPVLRVGERVLLLALVGVIDERRVDSISDTLLAAIRDERARAVVLDVTGVGEMNKTVADWLVRSVQAARMLGGKVILTGVSTHLAQVIVSLGTDLTGLTVVGDLQSGLEMALREQRQSTGLSPERPDEKDSPLTAQPPERDRDASGLAPRGPLPRA